MSVENKHYVSGNIIIPPFPRGTEKGLFGLGCFWGAEKRFWEQYGVYSTAVGYAGGLTPNPTYEEVCTSKTEHNEVVLVIYYPEKVSYSDLLVIFWESHNPTQGMGQGNDIGTQYRSSIYTFSEKQRELAKSSREKYQSRLTDAGFSQITTEILTEPNFYYAEPYHQQYLAKNPMGHCELSGTGISFFD